MSVLAPVAANAKRSRIASGALAKRLDPDTEVAIASTCNRTYLHLGANADAIDPAMDWLAEAGGTEREELAPHTCVMVDATGATRTLHRMFQRSFMAAKEVRSSTCTGPQSVSMAAACVRLAARSSTGSRTRACCSSVRAR